MKRIQEACICQTLRFFQKDGIGQQWAARQVQQEVEHYKQGLERNHTQYKILEETVQPDGSIILKIIKQYNSSPVGSYLSE